MHHIQEGAQRATLSSKKLKKAQKSSKKYFIDSQMYLPSVTFILINKVN